MTTTATAQRSLTMAFATPIATYSGLGDADLHQGLRKVILAAEATGGGEAKNVVGGWSSRKDLLSWPAPVVQRLAAFFQGAAGDMCRAVAAGAPPSGFEMSAWANVLRRGGYHAYHCHPNAMWSGVYYIATGRRDDDIANNGVIEFFDPRVGIMSNTVPGGLFAQRCTADPNPGTMIVFPGWLNHMVHPFHGAGERISISFNVAPPRPTSGHD